MAFKVSKSAADTPLRLPSPLPQQRPILASNKKRKAIRAGRRYSKSRTAMIAAFDGHGTPGADGVKPLPGILQGGDVVWVAKDYPQLSTVMWREEFVPRFKHLPYVDMNENEHFISVRGLGTLYLRPETAIGGIRGIGKKLVGVILDEAAFYDLEATLKDVVIPALLDNDGWLMVMSTTNAGHDGNAAKAVPSYFNRLCAEIQRGERSDWEEFYGTAYDNPRLSRTAIDALVAEYAPGSLSLRQEVFAELVEEAGRYYEVRKDVHLVEPAALPSPLPPWAEFWGAYDWGYAHWAVFGLFVRIGAATFLLDTVWMRRQQDDAQADTICARLSDWRIEPGTLPVYAGHDCWAKVTARGASGEATADVFATRNLFLERADIDRLNGGRAVGRALAAASGQRQEGVYIIDQPPRTGEVEALGSAGNRRVYDQLGATLPDPLDINKPWKVDANSDGQGGDDGSDMFRYGVATRVYGGTEPAPPVPLYTQRTGRPVPVPNRDGAVFVETPAPAPGSVDYGAPADSAWATPDAVGGSAWARTSTGDQFGE